MRRSRKRRNKAEERESKRGAPRDSCEIARNGFSHAAGALYHLMGATAKGTAPYGDPQGARPITRAVARKAPAPTHRDYLSHCDRGIRWSSSTFLVLFQFPLSLRVRFATSGATIDMSPWFPRWRVFFSTVKTYRILKHRDALPTLTYVHRKCSSRL